MENFLEILTKPDNIPIAVMLVVVIGLACYFLGAARRNDRLIKQGRIDEVVRRMNR